MWVPKDLQYGRGLSFFFWVLTWVLGAEGWSAESHAQASLGRRRAPDRVSLVKAIPRRSELVPRHGFEVSYGQSSELWNTFSDLYDARSSLVRAARVVQDHLGSFEGAWFQLGLLTPFQRNSSSLGWWKALDIGIHAEGAILGRATSLLPLDVFARGNAGGTLRVGLQGHLPGRRFEYRVGGYLGLGYEQTLREIPLSTLQIPAPQSGNLSWWGVEGETHSEWWENSRTQTGIRFRTESYARITNFFSSLDPITPDLLGEEASLTFRWNLRGFLDHRLGTWPVRLGVHGILGPQPLPSQRFPILWDRVLPPTPSEDATTQMGGGLHVESEGGGGIPWKVSLGMYGGGFGVLGEIQWRRVGLHANAIQIEQSSGGGVLRQRFYSGGLSVRWE
jgi:hypothetical protein